MNFAELLVIANFVLLVGEAVGGYIVIRSTISNAERLVEERVRNALIAENELLAARLARIEKENQRLDQIMDLVIDVLKKMRNIEIEVHDDMVIIRDDGKTHVKRITAHEEP